MRRHFNWLAWLGLACLPCLVAAEVATTSSDLPNRRRIVNYIHARPFADVLYNHGLAQDKQFGLHPTCRDYRVEPHSITILSPIDLPEGKPHPIRGIWNFRYRFIRCGETRMYNVVFLASQGGSAPTTRAYYPGETEASPPLVKDAMVAASTRAHQLVPGAKCAPAEVFDMRVAKSQHDVVENGRTLRGVWDERWTFRVCGKTVEVPIRFIPDANGGGTTFVIPSSAGRS
jgi:hypothetical protein